MKLLTSILLTFTLTVQACPSYEHMEQGSEAQCEGFFFNMKTNDRIKKDVRDNQLRKKQIELKDLQLNEITSDRNKWIKEAHNQAKARYQKKNDLRNGFLGGIGLTLALVFALGRVSK